MSGPGTRAPCDDLAVRERVRREVARRAEQGSYVYPLIAAILVLSSALRDARPLASSLFVAALALVGVLRARAARIAHTMPASATHRALVALISVQALLWGLFMAACFAWVGLSALTWLGLVLSAGFLAGGTSALGIHPPLHRVFVAALALPVVLAALVTEPALAWMFALVSGTYCAFLLRDGRQHAASFEALIRTQRELETARDAALSADRAKSAFLAMMSHEIRTPMHATIGSASLLLATSLNERQRGYAQTIERAGENLLALINGLLDFSRIEAQGIELDEDEFELSETLTSALAMFEALAEKSGISLRASLEPSVRLLVRGDRRRLSQVFINLIGNAVKFTPHGHVQLTARLRGHEDRVTLEASVRDTGIGIPSERLPHIFDPFVQGDQGIARRYGGSGLGLSITSRIVKTMGGSLEVSSEVGKGTTFTLRVPLAVAGVEKRPAPPTSLRVPSGSASSGVPVGARVLLVDDSALNRDIAAEMLRRLGCVVEVADDGCTALELAARETFELVLMDLEMGGMDGYEATRRLRSERGPNANVPVIAATASAFESDRRRALEAGMDDVLPKPFGLRELSAMLGRWLGQSIGTLARRGEQTEIHETPSLYPRATAHLATLLGEAADGQRIDRVVQAFLAQWPERASQLREAFARGDVDKAREILHALSGSASYLGVSSIDGLIARLHHRARQHDLSHTAELDQLEALIAELGESRERFTRARTGTLA